MSACQPPKASGWSWPAARSSSSPSDSGEAGAACGLTGHGPREYRRWSEPPPRTRSSGGPAMPGSYLVAGARTPIGKLSGALASFSAAELGGFAITAALERAGVSPEDVDHVIMGQVLMAGQGQVP